MKKIDFKKLKGKKKVAFVFWLILMVVGLVLGVLGVILALR